MIIKFIRLTNTEKLELKEMSNQIEKKTHKKKELELTIPQFDDGRLGFNKPTLRQLQIFHQ